MLYVFAGPTHGKVVMCYLATWATYRAGDGKFDLNDLDPSLCTHIVYIFAGIDENMMTIKSIGKECYYYVRRFYYFHSN